MNLREFFNRALIIVFALIITGIPVAPVCRALEIKINEEATIKDDVIRLGDIASFSPKTDPRVPELVDLKLGSSPYPGRTLTLNSRYLIFRLGAGIAGNEDIQVKVPRALLVSRSAQFVDSEDMASIFKKHIISCAPWSSENITFEAISAPGRLALPAGGLDWEIREKNHDDYIGNVHLVITFLVDGKPIRKASVSGRVLVKRDVLRAARNLRPGDIIEGEDVNRSREELSYIPKKILNNTDELIGKTVVRSIRTNQLIKAAMVEEPPLVKKGSKVLIKAESDRILITTLGKVLEDGGRGDLVKVVNVSSGKEIFATVRGSELVEVSF